MLGQREAFSGPPSIAKRLPMLTHQPHRFGAGCPTREGQSRSRCGYRRDNRHSPHSRKLFASVRVHCPVMPSSHAQGDLTPTAGATATTRQFPAGTPEDRVTRNAGSSYLTRLGVRYEPRHEVPAPDLAEPHADSTPCNAGNRAFVNRDGRPGWFTWQITCKHCRRLFYCAYCMPQPCFD